MILNAFHLLGGLFLFSAMAVKAQRIRRGQGAQPAKAPGTPVPGPAEESFTSIHFNSKIIS